MKKISVKKVTEIIDARIKEFKSEQKSIEPYGSEICFSSENTRSLWYRLESKINEYEDLKQDILNH